jgi:hypothetical protein
MANDNLPGIMPINMPYGNFRVRRYSVAATIATDLFIGDPVDIANTGTVVRATAGAGNYISGIVVGCYDSAGAPIGYCPSSTAGYVLVADDPNQQFIAQEDGDGSTLALADVGANVDVVINAGSTFNNKSGAVLDSSSLNTAANGQFRILAKQDRVNNDVGAAYCKWIVQINYHRLLQGTVGAAI